MTMFLTIAHGEAVPHGAELLTDWERDILNGTPVTLGASDPEAVPMYWIPSNACACDLCVASPPDPEAGFDRHDNYFCPDCERWCPQWEQEWVWNGSTLNPESVLRCDECAEPFRMAEKHDVWLGIAFALEG